jgi:hypothetical protein
MIRCLSHNWYDPTSSALVLIPILILDNVSPTLLDAKQAARSQLLRSGKLDPSTVL